jgi:hypothetical protein
MAQTVFDTSAREGLVQRLTVLTPTAKPRWGRMSAPAMVSHLITHCRMALGETKVAPKWMGLHYYPINRLVIRYVPIPRNAPTAPELVARAPGEWDDDVLALAELLRRVGQRLPGEAWPSHPVFGSISGEDWGVMIYRHVDHHFQQFGI